MKGARLLPILFLSFYACVDPLSVNLINQDPKLVVDGLITDQPGPYLVKLYYSTNLESTLKTPKVESGSSVWILSDANESELLMETEPGIYKTKVNGIKGLLGRQYKLKILTSDKRAYETNYQKLYSAGTLDSVFVAFKPKAITNETGSEVEDALNLLINAQAASEHNSLLRWRWKSIFKVKSFPELRTETTVNGLVPDPEPCSGYVRNGALISKQGECTCCICWSTEYNSSALVSESSFIRNGEFKELEIGKILITSMKFYDKLYLEVEQLSLSEEVYNFWKLVEAEQKASGNLFQPNAIKIRGNVFSVSDKNEEVFGIFTVAALDKKSIFINRSAIPYELPPIDTIPFDCRYSFANSTTEKPSFW